MASKQSTGTLRNATETEVTLKGVGGQCRTVQNV